MTSAQLIKRGLTHYWRTNLAVVAGVAAAVTVLAGALLVGDSVRASLRTLVEGRLGATDLAVVSSEFFRAALADAIAADSSFAREFRNMAPLVAVQGAATRQDGGRRSSRVLVYGVDERFWRFHGVTDPIALASTSRGSSRDVLLSPALARELEAGIDSTVLLRLQKPSAIPLESLHGRKDDAAQAIRLTVRGIVPAASLGEFSLQPQQGDVRAAFVPLARLQQDLGLAGRVNTLLVSSQPTADHSRTRGRFEHLVRVHATPEDLGLKLRLLTA